MKRYLILATALLLIACKNNNNPPGPVEIGYVPNDLEELRNVRYSWPEEKGLLVSQIQTGLGRTLDQVVGYYFWESGYGVLDV